MKLLFEYDGKKNFILAAIATFICYLLFLYIISLIIFLIMYFTNNYQNNQMLIYVLVPPIIDIVISLFSILSFRNTHTKLYKLHDKLILDLNVKGLTSDKYEINIKDIYRVNKLSPMNILGKTDIVIKANNYKQNDILKNKKIKICLALVCDFKTKKDILNIIKI